MDLIVGFFPIGILHNLKQEGFLLQHESHCKDEISHFMDGLMWSNYEDERIIMLITISPCIFIRPIAKSHGFKVSASSYLEFYDIMTSKHNTASRTVEEK